MSCVAGSGLGLSSNFQSSVELGKSPDSMISQFGTGFFPQNIYLISSALNLNHKLSLSLLIRLSPDSTRACSNHTSMTQSTVSNL